jgi:biopolymer transport protein ExbD
MRFTPRESANHPLMRLPLVALIDVVLFLLFYFMVAGTFSAEESHLSATLGSDSKGRAAGNLQPQILNVKLRDGKIVFQIGERLMESETAVQALLQQLPAEAGVVIRVAPDVPVSGAALAMQASRAAGYTKVTYVAGK